MFVILYIVAFVLFAMSCCGTAPGDVGYSSGSHGGGGAGGEVTLASSGGVGGSCPPVVAPECDCCKIPDGVACCNGGVCAGGICK